MSQYNLNQVKFMKHIITLKAIHTYDESHPHVFRLTACWIYGLRFNDVLRSTLNAMSVEMSIRVGAITA